MTEITLIGRLTADVEVRTTTAGSTVETFTVATNKNYGERAHSLFLNVTFFNDIPTKMKLKKGASVVVNGEIRQNTYTNKEGQKRTVYQVIGRSLEYAPAISSNAATPIVLIGRLTADINHNEKNTAGYSSLAVDHGYGDKKATSFYRTYFFGNVLARLEKATEKNGAKGTALMLVGDLDCREFTRQDGTKGIETFINVSNFNFVSYGKRENAEGTATTTPPTNDAPPVETTTAPAPVAQPAEAETSYDENEEFNLIDDDLPF